MNQKHIYLSSPTMNGNEMKFIEEAFTTNWIAPLGPNVDSFEKEIATYIGAKYSAAVSSGTAAIHLALKYLGVGEGDIVFCPSLTFIASCSPILYQGADPVFIDSEKDSWNMDPKALRKAFLEYPNVKAVIVVNLYGTPAKLDEILEICNAYQVPLIEDAAESFGATYHGRQTGTFGSFGVFSFNGNKIITTSGGGMLVTDNQKAIDSVKFWSTQAREKARHYEHKEIGYNYRMSNISAGIGRGQLLSIDDYISKKKHIYDIYQKGFEDIPDITMNPVLSDCKPNYWLSCITLGNNCQMTPLDIILALEKEKIEVRPIWKPMHLQPVFRENDFITLEDDQVSIAEDIYNRGLCLPSDIKNTKEDMDLIISIIRSLFVKEH